MMRNKDSSQPFYIFFKAVLNGEDNIKFISVLGMNSEGACIPDTIFSYSVH
jgi:hypothetical protein